MSIATIITRGIGSESITTSVSGLLLAGYSIGEEISVWTVIANETTTWTIQ